MPHELQESQNTLHFLLTLACAKRMVWRMNSDRSSALISSADTCTALNIDRSTLSRWVASERITPAMKLPGLRGAFLFSVAEVERVRRDLAAAS